LKGVRRGLGISSSSSGSDVVVAIEVTHLVEGRAQGTGNLFSDCLECVNGIDLFQQIVGELEGAVGRAVKDLKLVHDILMM